MLAKIIYARPQLLALDEPTNHLDIAAREALEGALTEYPGTILFVTHDRYLVQKISTHLLYIEKGRAYTFDRLSAFEEWLEGGQETGNPSPVPPQVMGPPSPGAERDTNSKLSKNRRDQLQKEVLQLEEKIATLEGLLAEMELAFQNPATVTDWEGTHQRYAATKTTLEGLYEDLANRWELMG